MASIDKVWQDKIIASVECESCQKLHKQTSEEYIVIWGAWAQPNTPSYIPKGMIINKTFGSQQLPLIVCRHTHCILKAMTLTEVD